MNTRNREKAVSAIRRIIVAAKELADVERAMKRPQKRGRQKPAIEDGERTGNSSNMSGGAA